jgi:murein DD-endopeptidase MepM/ murein hydrolase activator NlpD
VARGGILAELGSTGISRGPHVHFELIHGGRNCDPSGLFRPGIRHRDGHLSPIDAIQWRNPEQRPRGVACAPRRRFPRSRWVVNE